MILKNKCFFLIVVLFWGINLFSSSANKIYWGTNVGPTTLDPAQAWEEPSVFFTYNIFDNLVRLNINTLEIEPSLAISWNVRNNGKVWTFKLREGVKFHDGTEFNADAVVFSFQRQMDKQFEYRYYNFPLFEHMFSNIKEVRAVSNSTVEFSLFESFSPFLAILTTNGASIVSPTAVKKYKENFKENPVGSGPFKLKLWEKGKRIVLIHNPEYWRGRPDFKEFVFLINSNLETLHNSFGKQKIDVFDSLSISRSVSLKKLKWATFSIKPTISVSYIVFNFNNKYLKKENIRKAIRHLWDPRIIKYVYQDFVTPLEFILPAEFIKNKSTSGLEHFSLKKAKKLLKEEGISEKIMLDFLLKREVGLDRRLVSLFSKNFLKTGIQLRIKSFSEVEYKKRISKGDFDLTISGWIADYPDPHNILASLFYTQLPAEGFANLSSYQNSNIPNLIDLASRENDLEKRNSIYDSIVRMIDKKVLCIPIYQFASVIVFNNKKIGRIEVTPIGSVSLFDIEKK